MNTDIQTLNAEAKEISGYLQTTLQGSPEEIQQRIADTMAYVARTGEMLAEAKRLLRRRKSEEIQNTIIAIAKMKTIKEVVEGIKDMPTCPVSGERNLYYLLLKLKDKPHKQKREWGKK